MGFNIISIWLFIWLHFKWKMLLSYWTRGHVFERYYPVLRLLHLLQSVFVILKISHRSISLSGGLIASIKFLQFNIWRLIQFKLPLLYRVEKYLALRIISFFHWVARRTIRSSQVNFFKLINHLWVIVICMSFLFLILNFHLIISLNFALNSGTILILILIRVILGLKIIVIFLLNYSWLSNFILLIKTFRFWSCFTGFKLKDLCSCLINSRCLISVIRFRISLILLLFWLFCYYLGFWFN